MPDPIDLEALAKKGEKPPKGEVYRVRIDKEHVDVPHPGRTGRQILELVKKTPETHLLSQKVKGEGIKPVEPDQYIDFQTPGIERFQTLPRDPTEG